MPLTDEQIRIYLHKVVEDFIKQVNEGGYKYTRNSEDFCLGEFFSYVESL